MSYVPKLPLRGLNSAVFDAAGVGVVRISDLIPDAEKHAAYIAAYLTEQFTPRWTWAEKEPSRPHYHRFMFQHDGKWAASALYVGDGFTEGDARALCNRKNAEEGN